MAAQLDNDIPLPPRMEAVHLDQPFLSTTLAELSRLQSKRVFVMANKSSRDIVQPLLDALEAQSLVAAPLFTGISMGGGETGLLAACDAAAAADADAVVSVGGGAVQDAAKIVRMWLSYCRLDNLASGANEASRPSSPSPASLVGLQVASKLNPLPPWPPQVALPNSFAKAELTAVAGLTTAAKTKSGFSNPSLMPTVVIFDPTLTRGLPDWVRFGTALRCVEHAVGAVTHPNATPALSAQALRGLAEVKAGLNAMVTEPESHAAAVQVYRGGALAVRALNTNQCYPALGHLVANLYSAAFDVHQGACSGILCARLLAHHATGSAAQQQQIAQVLCDSNLSLSDSSTCSSTEKSEGNLGQVDGSKEKELQPSSTAGLVAALAAHLPGVECEHFSGGAVNLESLALFATNAPLNRFNSLSPVPFASSDEFLQVITRPLDTL